MHAVDFDSLSLAGAATPAKATPQYYATTAAKSALQHLIFFSDASPAQFSH
jgi:hypothetical protein